MDEQSPGPMSTETQGCSCHKPAAADAQDFFEKAWMAIENGNLSAFEKAIQELKSESDSLLNEGRVMTRNGLAYTMSLLAFCGFHQRKNMLDLLLEEGADMNAECTCALHGPGTPVTQMVLHCVLNDKLDVMIHMLDDFCQKGAELGGVITTICTDEHDVDDNKVQYDMLSLPLAMKKIDYAKELVKAGVDPVSGGNPKGGKLDVVPMFQEYYEHGTNEFIRWVFNDYIPQHPKFEWDAFTQQLIQTIIIMREKDKENGRWKQCKRTAAHAILTSGHQETIKLLIHCGKEKSLDLLAELTCTGQTALHHAAENNDVGSVDILLNLGADTRAYDDANFNPFMLAVKMGPTHLNVAIAIAKKDPSLVILKLDSGVAIRKWAQEKGHDAFFKVCSCHYLDETCPPQHRPFKEAWKAIEDGDISKLEQAIKEMKKPSTQLNMCHVTKRNGVMYSMTLLALSGFHGRKDMVDLLLQKGAGMNADCPCTLHGPGTPLPQMGVHCLLNDKLDVFIDMKEYFTQKRAKFGGVITTIYAGEHDIDKVRHDILSLLLAMKKFDYAKELVKAGVDPISGGNPEGEKLDVVPMFQEYYEHGTNEFNRWIFNEHIPQHPEIKLKDFILRLIRTVMSMKEKDKENGRWKLHKRTAAHAILTSGHQETIECLIQSGKAKGLDFLAEQSFTGQTALHHAAGNNNEELVDILLQLGADMRACDQSKRNPFMLAIEGGLTHLAKTMAEKDPSLLTLKLDSGLTVSNWAQKKGPDVFFKVCSCYNPDETCPPQHQLSKKAWKAIEDRNISKFERAIKEIRKLKSGPSTLLNVCHVTRRNGVMYSMTLLALSGFHGRKDMVDLLLQEGAGLSADCTGSGPPLSQMMLHSFLEGQYDKLNVTMLEYMIPKGANLTGIIPTVILVEHNNFKSKQHDMLTLALSMKKIDCAKLLVKAGLDPVTGGNPEGEKLNVVPMFQEYYDHGTNNFVRWVFSEYIPKHPNVPDDLVKFSQRIIKMIISMKERDKETFQWKSKGRTAAHAVLLSGNPEIIQHLVQCGREKDVDLLAEQTCTCQTALHRATVNNDELSVDILLQLGADTRAYDNCDKNPFMLAIEKGLTHLAVAKAMVEIDPSLVSLKLSSGLSMTHWALEKDHVAFFKMDNRPQESSNIRQRVKELEKLIRPESDCSCYDPKADNPFVKAWKAIEIGNISTFEESIQEMKRSGCATLLNACRITKGYGMVYSLTLLALCGFHGRREMVDLLLKEGADMNSECTCSLHGPGTPLSQMMLHGFIQHQYERLDVTMLQLFIQKQAQLCGRVTARHGCQEGEKALYDILSLPLLMGRIDCAKELVKAGIDPLTGNDPEGESYTVVPMFQEYCEHGTNEYIRWVFSEYIPQHPEVDLTHRIIKTIISMKAKDKKNCWWESKRRAAAHAILMCRHLKTIEHLVHCGRKEYRLDLLAEQNCTGKTALHRAAFNNDDESVNILMKLGANTRNYDYCDRNPFMLAVEKGLTHLKVAKAMLKRDPTLVSLTLESGMTVIHWALEKGRHCNAFFKSCFEEVPSELFRAVDSQGNRIGHLVAASGNTEVIKILWSERFVRSLLTLLNKENKTALQLAVEKGHIHVLKTLKECVDGGRECTTPSWHRRMKRDWRSQMIPLFLYASSCGSLSAVKYFIDCGYKPNIRFQPNSAQDRRLGTPEAQTPLLNAARGGHDEIVAYLLQFSTVSTHLKRQPEKVGSASQSPLLLAAKHGHTKCVTHLLRKGAKVLQRDSSGKNCLRLAVQNLHEDTALAILAEKDGLTTLETDHKPATLQLLIKEMPDLAEFVLNKCVTQDDSEMQGGEAVHYNYEYLEKTWTPKSQNQGVHILYWMIQNKKFLQHPLLENYFFQKFWGMILPLLLLQLLFYCTFLISLNSLALILPRPGPDSEMCPENTIGALNDTNSECQGQCGDKLTYLAAVLYVLISAGFLLEFWQLNVRRLKYFQDVNNYFQLALYTLTTIFVFDFDDCWCATTWQWQIGALAVFLSWFNFILILRSMPHTAVPVNIFLSICVTFLKLIFLPIMLVLAFGIPFYMIFVRTTASHNSIGGLVAFRSPGHAIAKTLLQLVGEFDFEATFNQGDLLYSPTTYILFITFLITMPVLFLNLLTGLAVGDTQDEKEKAEFTKHNIWVEFILDKWPITQMHCKQDYSSKDEWLSREVLPRSSWIGFILTLLGRGFSPENHYVSFFVKLFGQEYKRHVKIVNELKERNDHIYETVMAHNPVDTLRKGVTELKKDVKQEMVTFKTDVKLAMNELALETDMKAAMNEVTTLKTDMKAAMNEVTTLKTAAMNELTIFKTDMMAAMNEVTTFKTDMKAALNEVTTLKTDMKAAMNELTTFKTDMKTAMKEELSDAMKTLMQVLTSKMEAMGSGR